MFANQSANLIIIFAIGLIVWQFFLNLLACKFYENWWANLMIANVIFACVQLFCTHANFCQIKCFAPWQSVKRNRGWVESWDRKSTWARRCWNKSFRTMAVRNGTVWETISATGTVQSRIKIAWKTTGDEGRTQTFSNKTGNTGMFRL
jgi:hypothetical protein